MSGRVLFLAANPVNTVQLETDKELVEIQKILEAHPDHPFELVSQLAITTAHLAEAVGRHNPHVVHFAGHGDNNGSLVLHSDTGGAVDVPADVIGGILETIGKNVRLAVLNACYTQAIGKTLARHVDCVVGTTRDLPDDAARRFAQAFYAQLASGLSIAAAFRVAKLIVTGECREDEDVLELLVRPGVDPARILLASEVSPKPGLGAEFILDPKGKPDSDGNLYFIRLYVRNPPSFLTEATYIIDHESFEDPLMGSDNVGKACSDDFWTYGDVTIDVVLWSAQDGIAFRENLYDALRAHYGSTPPRPIASAMDSIRTDARHPVPQRRPQRNASSRRKISRPRGATKEDL